MTNFPVQQISNAYEDGRAAQLITGRSPYDLCVNPDDSAILTNIEALRRHLRRNYGMLLLTFSRSGGLDWDKSRTEDERDRKTIEQVLQAHKLLQIPQDEHETTRVIRGLSSLLRHPTDGLKWSDSSQMRFA